MNGISVYFAIVLSVLCNLSIDIPLDYAEYLKKNWMKIIKVSQVMVCELCQFCT